MTSELIVLSYFISRGDRLGLKSLPVYYFKGVYRDIYEAAMKATGEVSIPVVGSILEVDLGENKAAKITSDLRLSYIDEWNEVRRNISALNHKHGASTIKNAVMTAYLKLEEDGVSPFHIKSVLVDDLESARPVSTLKSFRESIEDAAEAQTIFLASGNSSLTRAKIKGFFAGNIVTMAGPSGNLKSTAATELIKWLLVANPDAEGLYFSKEQPKREIEAKFLAKEAHFTTYGELIQRFNYRDREYCEDVLSETKGASYLDRLRVVDPTEFSTPEDIVHHVRSAYKPDKTLVWVVDYVTMLDFGRHENQTTAMTAGLLRLKDLVHSTNSLGILISQLRKDWNMDYRSKQPLPILPKRDHLSWSSELVNISAYIFMLYYPAKWIVGAQKDLFMIHVDKMRFEEADYTMGFKVDFDRQSLGPLSDAELKNLADLKKGLS